MAARLECELGMRIYGAGLYLRAAFSPRAKGFPWLLTSPARSDGGRSRLMGTILVGIGLVAAACETALAPTLAPPVSTPAGSPTATVASPAPTPTTDHTSEPAYEWVAGPPMLTPRIDHHAVALKDGRVLVFGGLGEPGLLRASEVYDPSAGEWISVGDTHFPRRESAVALLDDGRVLAAGGRMSHSTTEAEVFDPDTLEWTEVDPLATPRSRAVAVTLNDGRVLVIGGANTLSGGEEDDLALKSSEIFDPESGSWTSGGEVELGRVDLKSAELLEDGRVLLAGGIFARPNPYTELFDPELNMWTSSASLPDPIGGGSAFQLQDGLVILAGGGLLCCSQDTLVYDPASEEWTQGAKMEHPRVNHHVLELPDGRYVALLGLNPLMPFDPPLSEVGLFSPRSGEWTAGPNYPGLVRGSSNPVLLQGGEVIITGGMPTDGSSRFGDEVHLFLPQQ